MFASFRGDTLFADHKCKEAAALYNDGKMRQEALCCCFYAPTHFFWEKSGVGDDILLTASTFAASASHSCSSVTPVASSGALKSRW